MSQDNIRSVRQPAIFMSHGGGPGFFMDGSGSLFEDIDMNSKPKKFFEDLSSLLPQQPRAIVVVSAHWEEDEFTVSYQDPSTSLIYDYYGFPRETYAPYITYKAPTDIAVAEEISKRLEENHITFERMNRGWDHGVFLPMKLAFPEANIPIVQVSLKIGLDPAEHVKLGKALSSMREDNILLIGSGSMTHNLGEMRSQASNSPAKWALDFTEWTKNKLEALNNENISEIEYDLMHIMEKAPYAKRCHPRTEHLVPLFFAFGAGTAKSQDTKIKCRCVFSSMAAGSLSLDTYFFD